MIWVCPSCHGPLSNETDTVRCGKCDKCYPCVGSIPDLRLSGESWLDHDEDLENARSLHELSKTLGLEQLIRTVFSRRTKEDEARIELRTRQVLEAPSRLETDVKGWLAGGLQQSENFLDLGCGGGMLAAAVAPHIKNVLGIDVSIEWLVVAERLITEHGGEPLLAAAMAEHMPLPNSSVSFLASLDVIEHVHEPGKYLAEINRVLKHGGYAAFTTPNRYSLTAEPHVFVWGVGLLPRRWQRKYVEAVSGKQYNNTCLLSYREIRTLVRKYTHLNIEIKPGTVPETEIARYRKLRSWLAVLYNRIHRWPVFRSLFLVICPFFQVLGIKQRTGCL